ncbi:hypothetical protein PALS2_128 [Staphylococcus phage PALS_2]|nr:hypothetical protein PALS2_128 [Staphylococcus phage PALS_2]
MKVSANKELLGNKVIPLGFKQLNDLYKDHDYVYLRIPEIFNVFDKYQFKDDKFVYIKTEIKTSTIVDLIDSLSGGHNWLVNEYISNDILNIHYKKKNLLDISNSEYKSLEETRSQLDLELEFISSNEKQRKQSNILIKDIHKEINYIRNEYTKVFTLKKSKTRNNKPIKIKIRNLYDEDPISILKIILDLGEEYCMNSTIFNAFTYSLMLTNNLDFIDEKEFQDIVKKEKVKNTFI